MGRKYAVIPVLQPHEPYKYLGIWVSMNLNWKYEFDQLNSTLRECTGILLKCGASRAQKKQMLQSKILPTLMYHAAVVPFTQNQIESMSNHFYTAHKVALRIQKNACTPIAHIPQKSWPRGTIHTHGTSQTRPQRI